MGCSAPGSAACVTRLKQKSLLAWVKSYVARRTAASSSGLTGCQSVLWQHKGLFNSQLGEESFSSLNIIHRLLHRFRPRSDCAESNHVESSAEGPAFRKIVLDGDVSRPNCLTRLSHCAYDLLNHGFVDKVV